MWNKFLYIVYVPIQMGGGDPSKQSFSLPRWRSKIPPGCPQQEKCPPGFSPVRRQGKFSLEWTPVTWNYKLSLGVNLTIQISLEFTLVGHWGGKVFSKFHWGGMITQIPSGVSPEASRYTPVHPGRGSDTGCQQFTFTLALLTYAHVRNYLSHGLLLLLYS